MYLQNKSVIYSKKKDRKKGLSEQRKFFLDLSYCVLYIGMEELSTWKKQ